MKVMTALTVLAGLTFLNCAIGMHTQPLGRRFLLASEPRTGVARQLESIPQPAALSTAGANTTAIMPTPRTAAHGVKAGNKTASNNTGTGARNGLDKWETIADNPTLPPLPVVEDTTGKRRKLLHNRVLLDVNRCTQAELQRAQMGFDMECLQPYNDRWTRFDDDWRRRFFAQAGRNSG